MRANSRSTPSASRMSSSLGAELVGELARAGARVVRAVEASGPKNRARMSFSMPTTSIAGSTKCATASEPISPPEPVTIAVGIGAV